MKLTLEQLKRVSHVRGFLGYRQTNNIETPLLKRAFSHTERVDARGYVITLFRTNGTGPKENRKTKKSV